ncbi:hypothetical protein DICPUDRAFT_84317 [Dictyostelium purpureum]|uniref:Uncharacterized protein n=1 Tax=Dictyostelium purpureum TaxID=5786 RepID=F1A298_DICPU|nr:uncharacterized protein DICPUDRAFT_84317 [Dictyostelium purpureum]EGC29681.1 hypothetical protein DICPUDRAFT_84317 [Dictyostelium purpureum]|eukprot:XP_003293786.1 hypothetical protein DICPUDRAFT_84317 [Dictyostelium purpureum]
MIFILFFFFFYNNNKIKGIIRLIERSIITISKLFKEIIKRKLISCQIDVFNPEKLSISFDKSDPEETDNEVDEDENEIENQESRSERTKDIEYYPSGATLSQKQLKDIKFMRTNVLLREYKKQGLIVFS